MGIVPKTFPVAGYPPAADSIVEGELALNTGDGRLYTKLASGRVTEIVVGGRTETAAVASSTTTTSTSTQSLATVATTGSYSDLVGVPSSFIPVLHSHPLSQISQGTATTGDVITWNGSSWVPAAPTVSSGSGSETLSGLTDTVIGSAASGQALVWTGSAWQNGYVAYSNITGTPTSMTPSAHASSHRAGGPDAITPSSINAVESTTVTRIVRLTQSSYDAITNKSSTTLYVIIN